ncbi:hypothetical protein [Rubritalea sp.]
MPELDAASQQKVHHTPKKKAHPHQHWQQEKKKKDKTYATTLTNSDF